MRDEQLDNSPAETLAELMNLDAGESPWDADDLAAIWTHQLAAPLEFDLTYLQNSRPASLDALHAQPGPRIASFRDLFHHPNPPIALLRSTKDFAKASRNRSEAPLPDEIATLLYLSSIVAAMTRLKRRITRLDDQGLRHALQWALAEPWIDDETRKLLLEGMRAADAKEPD